MRSNDARSCRWPASRCRPWPPYSCCGPRSRPRASHAGADPIDRASVSWAKAPCRFCGTGCGVMVGVERGQRRRRARRRGEPGQQGPAVRQGLSPAGRCCMARPPQAAASAQRRRHGLQPHLLGRGARPDRRQSSRKRSQQHGPEAVAVYGSGQWTVFDGYAALKWVKGGHAQQQPRAERPAVHVQRGHGLHDAVPKRRADGLLRRLRAGRRLRALGQQHGGDAPGPVQPHSREQARKADGRASSISPRATRPPRNSPTSTSRSSPTPTWPSPTASCTCSSATGLLDEAFIDENVVFKRGIEDLEKDRLRLLRRPGRAIHVHDEPRDSSLDELNEFLQDYTPDKVSADHRRRRSANRGARQDLWRPQSRHRQHCGAWA